MKFDKYQLTTDKHGFKYAKQDIMLTDKGHECLQCGALTRFVEVFSEAAFCSDECVDRFYKEHDI